MKKVLIGSFVLLTIAVNLSAQNTPKAKPKTTTTTKAKAPVFKNLLDSFSYAAGINVATNMKTQGINKLNVAMMQKGLDDVFKNSQLALTTEAANNCMQKQLAIFASEKGSAEKASGLAFLEANKKRQGVITLPNGLQYEIIKKSPDSIRNRPIPTDSVLVNYIGTLSNGAEFDNSYKRGSPYLTSLKDVIRGWTEILQLMAVGDHWKVYIPSELGYGEYGNGPNIPPHSVLVFEMVLEGIRPAVVPPKANQ